MATPEHEAVQPILDSGKIISFPKGIPGFETCTRYALFHRKEKSSCVYWLESADDPEISFTLVDPTEYGLNYSMDLSDEEARTLGTDNPGDLAVLLMLSKKNEEGRQSSLHANIAGPIILNPVTRLGIQKVLESARLDVNIVQQ